MNIRYFLFFMLIFGFSSTTVAQISDTIEYSGQIDTFVVPLGVSSIEIQVWGAEGGSETWQNTYVGGLGAYGSGVFSVNSGDSLFLLAGGKGEEMAVGAGGGGTFVSLNDNIPLIIAGGGGGASTDQNGVDGTASMMGTASGTGLLAGGDSGNGGNACSGGASAGGGGGFLSNGQDGGTSNSGGGGGHAFINGGMGGFDGRFDNLCNADAMGGFGGGGGTSCNTVGGGGGGGYSGGGGGAQIGVCNAPIREGGGGGGSYNAGSNPVLLGGANVGNGRIVLTYTINDVSVPTMSEWGVISLLLLILIFAIGTYKNVILANIVTEKAK